MIRFCPNCASERSLAEIYCEGLLDGEACNWDLTQVAVHPEGWRPSVAVPAVTAARAHTCPNGHAVSAGDLLCPECGADIASSGATAEASAACTTEPPQVAATATIIDGWIVERRLAGASSVEEAFLVRGADGGPERVLLLYAEGAEPDAQVYEALTLVAREHVPEIYATGRWQGRAYEVGEYLRGGSLADLARASDEPALLQVIVAEIGSALNALAERSLRHRNLRPDGILTRERDPLDLVITGFGSARLAEFDLEIVSPLETTRYTAPEAIAGGVAAASDWWSLGILLLERVTAGACFAGVNDQAFLIHVLTNGAPIPGDLDPRVERLLRGLLTRDRQNRWGWSEICQWLAGETPPIVAENASTEAQAAQSIMLGGRSYARAGAFALAAAQSSHWTEARDVFLSGALATWAEEAGLDAKLQIELRQLAHLETVSDDLRFALALKALNPAMPLALRGEIVTPGWLLDYPDEGYALITGPAPAMLQSRGAELWLSRLAQRAELVRARAGQLDLLVNEDELRVWLLCTSRSRLAAEWSEKRRILPDTDHPGLVALLERRQTTDEDLILLLSAQSGLFRSLDDIVASSINAARVAGVQTFSAENARAALERTRRDLYTEIDARITGFSRCGIARVDEWADQFRLERRLPIERALVLLAVDVSDWKEPPGQAYVAALLKFFSKRVTGAVMRGPLTRMVIGKTTPRVDLCALGGERVTARSILDHLLLRNDKSIAFDPAVFGGEGGMERRLRMLYNHATLYRRDTGIDGLYLGFPFLLLQEARANVKPRIAPVLLWPIKLELETGARGQISIAFDRAREQVRLNPAFEPLLGTDTARQWREMAEDLLGRSSISAVDVIDAFAARVASLHGDGLVELPGKDVQVQVGHDRLACAAVLFHLAHGGQSVMEELKRLEAMPPGESALAQALRIGEAPVQSETPASVRETERYFTAASDPSQEAAVMEARNRAGLLIEGPPGTGKSQTIVNMIADAIGQGRTLLVVCQKQAALDVVMKRLNKEGLGDRVILVTDVNKDRDRVIKAIRVQIETLHRIGAPANASWKRRRRETASRIETLEAELDQYHEALHAVSERYGLSYRQILADLIEADADGQAIDAPAMRSVLAACGSADIATLQEQCGPLAPLWLPARFEDNPLDVLMSFGADSATIDAFTRDWETFAAKERERHRVVYETPRAVRVANSEACEAWTSANAPFFRALEANARRRLAGWSPHFAGENPIGEDLLRELRQIVEALSQMPAAAGHAAEPLAEKLADGELERWAKIAEDVTGRRGFLDRLSPGRWLRQRRLARFLEAENLGRGSGFEFVKALRAELSVRPFRRRLELVAAKLRVSLPTNGKPASKLGPEAARLAEALREVKAAVTRLRAHPTSTGLRAAIVAATSEAFEEFLDAIQQGSARYVARAKSLAALQDLKRWFKEPWLQACSAAIEADGVNDQTLADIQQAAPSLKAFQRYRPRALQLHERQTAIFKALRTVERALDAIPVAQLDTEVRRILLRESRLHWKTQIEIDTPILTLDRTELEAKAGALAKADADMRSLNAQLLREGIDTTKVKSMTAWEDATRLTGRRARRLREFFELGADLGLMEVRPIWLMNPDIASTMLPLRENLFDTVIYDEASQIPVEYALPTLYRGRSMVVSGDEKQMPPTSFFTSRVENDEADVFEGDEAEEGANEEERAEIAENWNRREIKDCPDLLQLAKAVLPKTTLQIHYRSVYRELIQFSNAAFYANALSVPARHPEEEVRRVRPIELVRADGIYRDQTNLTEAQNVVEVLGKLWSAPGRRDTIGVVTFNRKQADLIEDVLEERAISDPHFREVLAQERERVEHDEDVSFFVKNVENVQGDERDVIVFSSTFGRNDQGQFRRSFGVLGQTGGERRLNVAVSRAKRKVVLVTSMPIPLISDLLSRRRPASTPRDYLQGYFEYARAISDGELDAAEAHLGRFSSGRRSAVANAFDHDAFQMSVAAYIRGLGFSPKPVGDDGAFGLDFAVEDPRTGLFGIGIECDAPRNPLLKHARAREMWRPTVLRRSVSAVHRVSSQGWCHNRDAERGLLRKAITEALTPGGAYERT